MTPPGNGYERCRCCGCDFGPLTQCGGRPGRAIAGKPSFSSLSFTVNHSKFAYGAFINALLSFAIIAAVVYFFVVVPATKVLELSDRKQEATERECPECLSKIPIAARRCMYCAAQVPPATQSVAGASAD